MDLNDSIVIVDKPPGPTSHEVVYWVKNILGVKRAGHSGTLDPQVSGVLPVALGRATKLLGFITKEIKEYVGVIKFRKVISEREIKELFDKFTGEIIQTPPKMSAVKKVPRKRIVYFLKYLERKEDNPKYVLFHTKVQAGTYIRTLCEDIGKLCGGARMVELRRIAVGKINENVAVKMEEIADAFWVYKNKGDLSLLKKLLYPPDSLISYPKIVIKKTAALQIERGAQLMVPGILSIDKGIDEGSLVKIYSEDGSFIGIGRAVLSYSDILSRKRGLAIKIERMHKKNAPAGI